MTFKGIDFNKLHEKWWSGLSKEEQDHITLHKKLEKENTLYTTTTLLDDVYSMKHYGKEKKEVVQEVKLYRLVRQNNTVDENLRICFGGYRQYYFDGRFVERTLHRLSDSDVRFCIDMGAEVYVKNSEMKRIIAGCIEVLNKLGIDFTYDYDPEFTNSDMGKMLVSMGLR